MTPAERYLRLGLRLGRHDDGLVDAWFGPADLKAAVDAEAPVEPAALVADAEALLGELEDGWLRDQVVGLRTAAGVLAGESWGYADEVESCFGVRPTHTDEAVFEAAHERLDELLPGAGPLRERHARRRDATRIPLERLESAVAAVVAEARARTRALFELPEAEGVDVDVVHGEPWLAFCEYAGDFRSLISVNADLPISAFELLRLALHETYPGHHTERVLKDRLLVRGRGLLEESIALVPTPRSLVSEAIAELAPFVLLEAPGAEAFAAATGADFDLPHALAVERAAEPCRWAEVNAALMLHEGGASEAEAQAYLERWGLLAPELAAHVVRFVTDPGSRTYVVNYAAGGELARAYVAGDPARFRRLLTEQVRVGELLAAASG